MSALSHSVNPNIICKTLENQFNPPRLAVDQKRWAVFREERTEKVCEYFSHNPDNVLLFNDPKLAMDQVIMMRKSHLDCYEKLLHDLVNGQAAVQHHFQTVFDALGIIEDIVKKEQVPENVERAVRIMVNAVGSVRSSVVFVSPTKSVSPTIQNDEEMQSGLED